MKKFKLFMSIATMCLALAVLCFGVFSATQVSYNIGGSISYEVNDVFVKITTNVYKVAGNDPKSKTEMESDISELKTKELSSIDTTKYIPSQVDLGVYDSSKEISETNINSATGINIVYGKDTQGTAYYTYYIVINVENLSTRTDVCAHIEDKTTSDTNSIKTTSTYINNITSANETKNIVIGYSLKDKTTSIDNIEFNYTLIASFEAYEEDDQIAFIFEKNEDDKTVSLTHYSGTDSIVNIPKTISFAPKKLSASKIDNYNEFERFYLLNASYLNSGIYTLTYNDSSTSQKVSKVLVGIESLMGIVDNESVYPVKIDYGSFNILKKDYESYSEQLLDIISSVINDNIKNYVTISFGTKYAEKEYSSANETELNNIINELSATTKPADYDTYFPMNVQAFMEQYCEGNDYKVTSIGEKAFCDGMFGNDKIRVVNIPDGITTIASRAFYRCRYLRKVTIPVSVTSIAEDSFLCCNKLYQVRNLSSVEFPFDSDLNKSICEVITDNTSEFQSIYDDNGTCITYAKDGITYLIGASDASVSEITANDIPDSVTIIADCAFYQDEVTSFEVPKQITKISRRAFYVDNDAYNTQLESFKFEEGSQIQEIGDYAFDGHNNNPSFMLNLNIGRQIRFGANALVASNPIVITLLAGTKLVSGSDTFTSGSTGDALNGKTWTVVAA